MGSANTMKGAIAVENATPTSASMVGARIAARSVELACANTTRSRRDAGSATLAKGNSSFSPKSDVSHIWRSRNQIQIRGSSETSLHTPAALTDSNLEAHDFRLEFAAGIVKSFAGKRKAAE